MTEIYADVVHPKTSTPAAGIGLFRVPARRHDGTGKIIAAGIESPAVLNEAGHLSIDLPPGPMEVRLKIDGAEVSQDIDWIPFEVPPSGSHELEAQILAYSGAAASTPSALAALLAALHTDLDATYAAIDDPRFDEATGLDEAAVAASISNPETTVNAAVINVVESVIPSALISTVVIGDDLSHARPPGGGAVHWVTTEPAPAQPLNIQTGDFVSRVTETLVEWTPLMLPNLFAWYDAESLAATADTAIAQWTDLSGNGHHAKQATGASQPLYRATAFNGHPCLEFDGTNDILITDPFTASIGEAFTVYAAVHSTPVTTTGSDFFFGALSDTNVAQRLDGYRPTGNLFTISRGTALAGPALDNTPHRLRAVFNGGGSSLRVGDTLTSGTTPLTGVNVAKLTLGGRGDNANFLQGYAAGYTYIKGTVSIEDDANMVAWMQNRYSLA